MATPHSLIASDRVEGTPVVRAAGEKIGRIERLMIDKVSGKIAYAVLTFGGFLGMGEKHFPVPWESLRYDPALGGYVLGGTDEQLRSAPSYDKGEDFDWGDRPTEALRRHYHSFGY